MSEGSVSVFDEFASSGRIWYRQCVPPEELKKLDELFERDKGVGSRIGVGSALHEAVGGLSLNTMLQRHWPKVKPVRIVSFDKSGETNWALPWHQDRVIAVKEKCDVPGYTNWTRKPGIWHCEPPVEVLQNMLFVRLHLDDCDSENGAMEIALGSHSGGMIPGDQVAGVAEACQHEVTEAKRGDVLVLSMMTLHRSGASKVTDNRRVLRIDFNADALPEPLEWAYG